MQTKQLYDAYIASTYKRNNLFAAKAQGCTVYDEDGREYIDLGSGIAVNSLGFCDKKWIDAVTNQLNTVQHMSNLYYTSPQARLAQLLCGKTGLNKVFFGNSGAEANECAIKCARKYSYDKYGQGRHRIITLTDSFHGRTMAALSATGQDVLHPDCFAPFLPGFVSVPAGDIGVMKAEMTDKSTCAVMLELVQGEGGVNVLDREYVSEIVKLAQELDILVIIDEVQTGNGRTGSLYAYMQYGFTPDILTTAKGLAGGLPFGACVMGEKVKDTMTSGTHGSTFGGNPVCAAGAMSILERITDELLADVREKGEYIKTRLQGAKGVRSVSGLGLMLGIQTEKPVSEILPQCLEKGLIVLSAHDRVRLLPALNISMTELEKAMEILKGVLA